MFKLLRKEIQLVAGWGTVALVLAFGHTLTSISSMPVRAAVFLWLFGTILWGAFNVVRHAEELAHRLGEPFGTLVLTMSVTVIEVSFIFVVMLGSDADSTLARDTVFSVLMITLNGVAGICILVGGLRHQEQSYNLQGARAFLAVIMPLSVIALVLPNFTTSTPGPTLSHLQALVFGVLTIMLYGVFLAIQTVRHTGFFTEPVADGDLGEDGFGEIESEHAAGGTTSRYHTVLLLASLVPVILLTEELAHIVEDGIHAIGAPQAFAGLLVAILVLSPEAFGALRAALDNKLQRAVNISLGSALATIGLTVPSVLAIGIASDRLIQFGLNSEEMVLLTLTLVVAGLTFGGTRTNILQGAVHLVLFAVFLVLMFDP
ncbi:calcium:proton antiporter [Microbaculum marinum]|uniref:Calcium:proton antiporter n=1 Tax=Microbaculum marinum TaxID=1764581 RepID=A0AAW9RWE2_9HYPH